MLTSFLVYRTRVSQIITWRSFQCRRRDDVWATFSRLPNALVSTKFTMNRKFWMRIKRRFRMRLTYYLILIVVFIALIRWLMRSSKLSETYVESAASASSASAGLQQELKVSSTSKNCRKTKQIDIYELCYETNVGRIPTNNVILLSAESESSKLEDELPYELEQVQIHRLLSEERGLYIKLVNYLSRLPTLGHLFWFENIKSACKSIQSEKNTYNLLKLGNLPAKLEKYKAKTVINLSEFLGIFHQILIVINADGENDAEWIQAVQLLKSSNYQLFSVHKDCNGVSCTFATSWLKLDDKMLQLDEEINPLDPNADFAGKLHSLLRTTSISCKRKVIVPSSVSKENAYTSANRWPVCLDEVQAPCTVYSAKTGSSELFENILARLGCDVYIFDSTLGNSQSNGRKDEKMHKYNWTLGGINAQIVSGLSEPDTMTLVKASDVVKKLGHEHQLIDILRLDLHGGEWDVIDSILTAQQDKIYQQLLLTVHVWVGEDKLNLLDRLIRLKKLFKANYRIFHSEPLNLNDNYPCCYVIGLINSNLIS